jgi:hypothetical protein
MCACMDCFGMYVGSPWVWMLEARGYVCRKPVGMYVGSLWVCYNDGLYRACQRVEWSKVICMSYIYIFIYICIYMTELVSVLNELKWYVCMRVSPVYVGTCTEVCTELVRVLNDLRRYLCHIYIYIYIYDRACQRVKWREVKCMHACLCVLCKCVCCIYEHMNVCICTQRN